MFRFFNVIGCTLSGFEIMNGSEGIVFDYSSQCACTENFIHDNNTGIAVWNSDNIKISSCIIDTNAVTGIDIWQSSNVDIDHNTILRSQNSDGITIGGTSDHLIITNNILAFNNAYGIETTGLTFTDFVYEYNCFWQNGSGNIHNYPNGSHSFESDPLLMDINNQNYYLQSGSPCIGNGSGGSDIGALGEPGGTDVDRRSEEVVTEFALHQNFPNPFNPTTTIPYALPNPAQVTLNIYNLRGEKIATLVNQQKSPGHYTVEWDGRDRTGHPVASGIYLYRIEAGQFVMTRKMLFVR
jgi:parallel beta-helix repeat protein